jgi:hypothetical protein
VASSSSGHGPSLPQARQCPESAPVTCWLTTLCAESMYRSALLAVYVWLIDRLTSQGDLSSGEDVVVASRPVAVRATLTRYGLVFGR